MQVQLDILLDPSQASSVGPVSLPAIPPRRASLVFPGSRRSWSTSLGSDARALDGGRPKGRSSSSMREMGLEGIVSKRKASWYQSSHMDTRCLAKPSRSRDWVKAKNPKAPAVTRLAEEEWGR
jgi:hypothetical protein